MTKLVRSMAGLPSILVLTSLLLITGTAQAQAPIELTLIASRASYLDNEPITLEIRVRNTSGVDVITPKGFFGQRFDLKLTFIAPDGEVIRFTALAGGAEPRGPICFEAECNAVLVEVIPPLPDGEIVILVDDAKANYDLAQLGHYQAFVSVPLDVFPGFAVDPETGERFARLDPPPLMFDPLTSKPIFFDIASLQPIVRSTIEISATKSKIPLENLPVRLFKRSVVLEQVEPINKQTFPLIWQLPVVATALTNAQGRALFGGVSQDDYVVIGEHRGMEDSEYIGSPIGADDPNWQTADPIKKNLKVKEKVKK